MEREQLIEYCRKLFEVGGLGAIRYPALKKHKGLYFRLYYLGVKHRDLLQLLGVSESYREHKHKTFIRTRGDQIQRGWTWQRVLDEAADVVKQLGFLPPAQWFQENGRKSFVQAVYYLGKDWALLREQFHSFSGSHFVESRNASGG